METLTLHLGFDELVDHWTLLAGESDLRRQARCAVRRDRAGGLLAWSGPHLIFHAAHSTLIRRSRWPYGSGAGAVDPRGPESEGDDATTVTVELSPCWSQVHCPGESGRAGRDRDPVARHADVETASIPIELDFGRYRHAQEVTDCMSIETVDTRASAAAVALVRHRAPETRFLPIAARPVPDHPRYFQVNRVDPTGRALPGGWTFLVDPTKRTVVRTSGDPDRLDFAAALRRGTRA